MQYAASRYLASGTLPTTGALRAVIKPPQLGSGDFVSHSFSISLMQSLCFMFGAIMALRVPGDKPRPSPM